jgi:hypothetical protein
MNTTSLNLIVTAALGVLTNAIVVAQTWQNVDLFQLQPNLPAGATDLGIGPDGSSLYSVGWATFDANGNNAAIVRKSTDAGITWATVDNYVKDGWSSASYRAVGAGAGETLFVAGELWAGLPNTGTKSWIIRESGDGGATWETVDEVYQGPTAKPSCGDVKVNPYTGDVFAVGRANASSSEGFYWLVRKRAAGAQSFETVDLVGAPPINDARAIGFHSTAGIFVVGRMGDSQRDVWTVRRSTDGGVTWATVDSFQDSAKTYSEARGIAVSGSGAIYVCGRAAQVVKGRTVNNWVVRRSVDGGATWTTVDRFGAEPAPSGIGSTTATAITISPSGKVYVAGQTPDPSRIVVRMGTTSSKGAMSWVTIDDYQAGAGLPASPQGMTSDISGNIFTSGNAEVDSSGITRFLTRKLSNP